MADLGRCSDCGISGTGIMLDSEPLCDRCADYRLSVVTGWPTLPDPPAPEVIIGPDDRKHLIRYRLLRMPTAVLALAEELGVSAGSGYQLEIHCNHFADPGLLLPRIQARARVAVAHPYLEPNEWHGWRLPGHGLGGRLEEEDEQGTPPDHASLSTVAR